MKAEPTKKQIMDKDRAKRRRDAGKGTLRERRVYVTEEEELKFNQLTAPLGAHIYSRVAALEKNRLYTRVRCVAKVQPALSPATEDKSPESACDASQASPISPAPSHNFQQEFPL